MAHRTHLLLAAALALPAAGRAQTAPRRSSDQPAPCAGERASKVESERRDAVRRVELAFNVQRAHGTEPPEPLPDGTRIHSGPYYSLLNAAMLFAICPHDPDHFSVTADCVNGFSTEDVQRYVTTVNQVIAGIKNTLPGVPILCSPRSDPFCGRNQHLQRGAYSSARGNDDNPRDPHTIYLCPGYFQEMDLGGMTISEHEAGIRTLIHESAHIVGVHSTGHEAYCHAFDCNSSCFGVQMADAWAHLVNCLSGAPRDTEAAFNISGRPGR